VSCAKPGATSLGPLQSQASSRKPERKSMRPEPRRIVAVESMYSPRYQSSIV
jgi:hypothetical protein